MVDLDPDKRSWEYDGHGKKRNKDTFKPVDIDSDQTYIKQERYDEYMLRMMRNEREAENRSGGED